MILKPRGREQAERRATIGQRTMVLSRHRQSAGTVRIRPRFTQPARISLGDRLTYPSGEGQT